MWSGTGAALTGGPWRVPTDRMWAVDIEPGLWRLGFELFRGRGRMKARFIQGDFLSMADDSLGELQGNVDVVIASQFPHQFSRDGQTMATKRIVALSQPGTMLVGYQQGRKTAREYMRPWGMMFYHNLMSLVQLWDGVQQETNTQWRLEVTEVDLKEWGMGRGGRAMDAGRSPGDQLCYYSHLTMVETGIPMDYQCFVTSNTPRNPCSSRTHSSIRWTNGAQ